ncbi:MAG: hypothetical protein HKN49_05765, partial [Gammaproteobacteria bacterium]|nr:hypothetical protein [Gammaproteobacteria bacterium]
MNNNKLLFLLGAIIMGCSTPGKEHDPVVFAINVGGPAYTSVTGLAFDADQGVDGGVAHTLDKVLGSQDDDLYQTYREGAVRISRDVPPGFYDVTLHFAEPADTESGQRLFDIVINDQTVLSSLDVRRARDGQSKSALSVTFPSVGSNDGQLELELRPVAGEPILAAVEVRRPYPRDADWQLVWQDEFDYQGQPDPQKWNI